MYDFKQEISSSGKTYYRNNLTNETQWGFKTYYNKTKRLPKGWVRLNLDKKPIYKYFKSNKKVLTSSYAPTDYDDIDILKMSYEELLDMDEIDPDFIDEDFLDDAIFFQKAKNDEACRRNNLFEQLARLLKLKTESICDESLEFLCKGKDVTVEQIISFIEKTETKELGQKDNLTAFNRIKSTDITFSRERSVRELCGLNMREEEAKKAQEQIEVQFTCPVSFEMYKDPVVCSSGQTFERDEIITAFQSNGKCPVTRKPITDYIVPNNALRKVIQEFVEKYKNQKGQHWSVIVELCVEYNQYSSSRLQEPMHMPASSSFPHRRALSQTQIETPNLETPNLETPIERQRFFLSIEPVTREQLQEYINEYIYNPHNGFGNVFRSRESYFFDIQNQIDSGWWNIFPYELQSYINRRRELRRDRDSQRRRTSLREHLNPSSIRMRKQERDQQNEIDHREAFNYVIETDRRRRLQGQTNLEQLVEI
jgi:hypothetical protein